MYVNPPAKNLIIFVLVLALFITLISLSVFNTQITRVEDFIHARAYCAAIGTTICQMNGPEPVTWNAKNIIVEHSLTSCAEQCNKWIDACKEENNWTVKCKE